MLFKYFRWHRITAWRDFQKKNCKHQWTKQPRRWCVTEIWRRCCCITCIFLIAIVMAFWMPLKTSGPHSSVPFEYFKFIAFEWKPAKTSNVWTKMLQGINTQNRWMECSKWINTTNRDEKHKNDLGKNETLFSLEFPLAANRAAIHSNY